jgi:hypothetical protein
MIADTNGFYKYTITGASSINLIFNNGQSGSTNQTPDLIAKTNGYSYTWGASTAKIGTSTETDFAKPEVLVLYPNPVSDVLQINTTRLGNFRIFSTLGKILLEGSIKNKSIDVSKLSSGMYLIEIQFEDGEKYQQKILKR